MLEQAAAQRIQLEQSIVRVVKGHAALRMDNISLIKPTNISVRAFVRCVLCVEEKELFLVPSGFGESIVRNVLVSR